ncbi:hypothetical protein [Candidatus Pollutiaquabacter sp.]|uniref:hypothetical protein n=1 Tax=Candidatus Pollutiaquabacter sp. TaxID=3416354 RepID=UPI003C7F5B60|nr:hypothetical protein [Bacteroidota bacterium]
MEAISWERTLMLEKQLVENFAKVEAEERLVITRLEELAARNVVYDQINKLYSESIWIRSEADHRKYKTALNVPVMRRPDAGWCACARVAATKRAQSITAHWTNGNDTWKYQDAPSNCLIRIRPSPTSICLGVYQGAGTT